MSQASEPLKVSVVGAGVGGLAAAVALRRQGHQVQIFETSSLNKEVGLGIGIPPNGARVLESLGYRHDNLKGVEVEGATVLSSEGDIINHADFPDFRKVLGQPWTLCHRVDLHEELRRLALGDEGPGSPAKLHLGSAVKSCDPENGIITLEDGTAVEADVVVGADGINSTIRGSVLGYALDAPPSGLCAFRWAIDTSRVKDVENLEWLQKEGPRHFKNITSQTTMMITYPMREGSLINAWALYSDPRDQTKTRWNVMESKSVLQEVFKGHHPKFTAFLDILDDELLLCQLRVLPPLPTWTNGVTCLLGDAAHAQFPTMGQGAAIAFEDAATLGILIPLGTTKAQVPERLKAYQHLRKERAEQLTTHSIHESKTFHLRGRQAIPPALQAFVFGHDAPGIAQKYFLEHFGDGQSST